MSIRGYFVRIAAAMAMVALLCGRATATDEGQAPSSLPYRFLVVISDQWKDPASYLIDESGEFQMLATLLKTWGIPFDILRLDQERFDKYHLLDREGHPQYGTIIWVADVQESHAIDWALMRSLLTDSGAGLIVLGRSISASALSELAGVEYVSEYRLGDGLAFTGDHFITRGLSGREPEFLAGTGWEIQGTKVLLRSATALAKRAHLPFLTVRELPGNGGRVVWLGADRASAQISKQIVRDLFKRSLVWAQGYALYTEYPKTVMLFMDDFGTSDRTYLPYWHYRTLDEDTIRSSIIEPLKRHNAVLMEDVLTGYVDRKSRGIVNPWKQKVVDEIDGKTVHDYPSAKRGLDAGVREGVLEIQCHGYTHMLPDLESPPGPFWTAPMDGTGTLGFDEEFSDRMRGKEVPAITQKYFLRTALTYIKKDFGATPLFVINGGAGWSRTYPNSSPRIAAEMGFGLSHFGPAGYLGKDLVIPSMEPVVQAVGWAYDRKLTEADVPWTIDAPFWIVFHDRDVSLDGTAVERLLTNLGKGTRYMSANEYTGYLHARIERDNDAKPLCLAVSYDDHYGRYFASHDSRWTFHLSDSTREKLNAAVPEKQVVTIPSGLGRHAVCAGGAAK